MHFISERTFSAVLGTNAPVRTPLRRCRRFIYIWKIKIVSLLSRFPRSFEAVGTCDAMQWKGKISFWTKCATHASYDDDAMLWLNWCTLCVCLWVCARVCVNAVVGKCIAFSTDDVAPAQKRNESRTFVEPDPSATYSGCVCVCVFLAVSHSCVWDCMCPVPCVTYFGSTASDLFKWKMKLQTRSMAPRFIENVRSHKCDYNAIARLRFKSKHFRGKGIIVLNWISISFALCLVTETD